MRIMPWQRCFVDNIDLPKFLDLQEEYSSRVCLPEMHETPFTVLDTETKEICGKNNHGPDSGNCISGMMAISSTFHQCYIM